MSAGTLADGLIGYYCFESNALDSSTLANDGVLFGSPVWQAGAGRPGGTFYFDGINDHVRAAIPAPYHTSNLTVTAWVKPRTYYHSGEAYMLLSSMRANNISGFQMALQPGYALSMDSRTTDGQNLQALASGVFTQADTNVWKFVAGTVEFDGSTNTLKAYVDGDVKNSQSFASGPFGYEADATLFLGINYDSPAAGLGRNYDREFTGLMDSVRIYNRVLSTNELQTIFRAGF